MKTKKGFHLPLTTRPSTKTEDTLLLQCVRCGRWGNVYCVQKLTPAEKEDIALSFGDKDWLCGSTWAYVKEDDDEEDDYADEVCGFDFVLISISFLITVILYQWPISELWS